MSNFQKLIFSLAGFAIFLSVFSVLIISRSTLFPFIVGKYVFFRSSVSVGVILFLILLLSGWRPKLENLRFLSNPIFIAVGVFVFIFFLAGIFGVDFYNSFWSNFERGEGIYAMFYYFLFFLMALFLFSKDRDWEHFFQASIIAGLLVSFYGFAQKLEIPGVVNIGVGRYGRMQASLGNPAYVSAFVFFTSFYASYLLSQEKVFWKKIFYIFSLIVFALAFILAETRGAFFGLALAVLASAIFLFFKLPVGKIKKTLAAVFFVLILIFGSLFYFRDSELIKKLPASRVLFSSLSERTAQTRFWTWGSAWKGFLEKPLLGWGPENFPWVFDKYFDTRHFEGIGVQSETWFDRAHSVFFDYLSETGIPGLLSFLTIFVFIFRQIFKIKYKNIFQQCLTLALPIAYLGQAILLFDVLPIYINLFLFWAFIIHKSSNV